MLDALYANFTKSIQKRHRPHQGAKECARRVKQGITNYDKHSTYPYQRKARLKFIATSQLPLEQAAKVWKDCQCINKLGLKELKCNECQR